MLQETQRLVRVAVAAVRSRSTMARPTAKTPPSFEAASRRLRTRVLIAQTFWLSKRCAREKCAHLRSGDRSNQARPVRQGRRFNKLTSNRHIQRPRMRTSTRQRDLADRRQAFEILRFVGVA